jgi:hypothetical protein
MPISIVPVNHLLLHPWVREAITGHCSSQDFFSQGGVFNPLHLNAKKIFSKDLNRRKNLIF